MRATKADWPHLTVSRSKRQAIRDPVDMAVCAIAYLAVVEAVVYESHLDIEIDGARERHAVFRQIDRFLRRIELSHNCIYNLVFDQSSRAEVPCDPLLKTALRSAAISSGRITIWEDHR